MAKNAIGMSLATEEYGASSLQTEQTPAACLNTGVIKDIQRVKDSWNSAYQGTGTHTRSPCLKKA